MSSLHRVGALISLGSIIMTLAAFAVSVNSVPPVVTTVVKDFGITVNSFGYLFTLQFFVFMIASFAGGALIERTGIKPGLLVATGLAGLSVSFFILPLMSSFRGLLLWIVLLGFSGGLVEAFASLLVSTYDKPGSGRILSLSQVFYCLGAVAAPRIVAHFFDARVDWKRIFTFFGFMEIGMFLVFILLAGKTIWGREPKSKGKQRGKHLVKDKAFVFLGLSIFFYVTGESFILFWYPAFLEGYYSFSPAQAARGISYYWIGLLSGRIIVTLFPHRLSLWKILVFSSFGMFICALVLSFRWNIPFLVFTTVMIGLFSGPVWATIISIGDHSSGNDQIVSGIIGFGSLGASLGPLASALVIKYAGFGLFFPALSAVILVLIILIIYSNLKINAEEAYS